MTENEISKVVIDTAMQVHKELGPGLLESVYETVLSHELSSQGLNVARQVPVSIKYRGIQFEVGFRADIIVDHKVILELKCIENLNYSHKKQLLTYLRLTELKLGLILNFSEGLLKNGITRVVNKLGK